MYEYNQDFTSELLENGEVRFEELGLYIVVDRNAKIKNYLKKCMMSLLYILCTCCLYSLPVVEIVYGYLYFNNSGAQCDVMQTMTIPTWLIVKGSVNIFIVSYSLLYAYVKNCQDRINKPIQDHPMYDKVNVFKCIYFVLVFFTIIWMFAGVTSYISNCGRVVDQPINDLMKYSLIFEYIKYIFVVPMFDKF